MEKDTAFVGDYIATIEEYVPGEGTYAENGKIYAASNGKVVLDKEKHVARVEGKHPLELKVGQTVFGEVANIRKSIVNVSVSKIEGEEGQLGLNTGIYVSNISDGYVERPEDMFGIGDIVKAKVIKIEPNIIDLSTKGEAGVVKAFCKRCRHPLVKSKKLEGKLECESCGHKETRKIAKDYGNVTVI